jgi:hypothetical protein
LARDLRHLLSRDPVGAKFYTSELPAPIRDPLALALDVTPEFRPVFYPGTYPNYLLAVFGSSVSAPNPRLWFSSDENRLLPERIQ